jgi:hypothetical protein
MVHGDIVPHTTARSQISPEISFKVIKAGETDPLNLKYALGNLSYALRFGPNQPLDRGKLTCGLH